MENKTIKKIVLKKEAISNLNETQMNLLWAGNRNVSYETLNQAHCDTYIQCCTLYEDCKRCPGYTTTDCPSYTPVSC